MPRPLKSTRAKTVEPVEINVETKEYLAKMCGITDRNSSEKMVADVNESLTWYLYGVENPTPSFAKLFVALKQISDDVSRLLKDIASLDDRVTLRKLFGWSLFSSDRETLINILSRMEKNATDEISLLEPKRKSGRVKSKDNLRRTMSELIIIFSWYVTAKVKSKEDNLQNFMESVLDAGGIRNARGKEIDFIKTPVFSFLSRENKRYVLSLMYPQKKDETSEEYCARLFKMIIKTASIPKKKIRAQTKKQRQRWNSLDKLQGEEYEEALKKLTSNERDQYLEDIELRKKHPS